MRTGALAILVASAVLLAGCGSSGAKSNGEAQKSAAQVAADARKAAVGASAVHVSGSIVSSGTPLTMDIRIVKGTGGSGEMSEQGLKFQLVRVAGKAYIKGSDAFYKKFAGAGVATLLHDKWLAGSATTGSLAALTALTDIAKLFSGALGSHGTLKNEGETTYKGQKVVAIKDTSKGGTLYVAATGTPYPIAIVAPNNGKQGSVSFDDWNKTVSITAPKGSIDVASLGGS
ncbi:MAG TPA: hypothetical protein VMS63_02750 [Gaiellaceae bacterium]|jgi:hypothetical protein|nr:hypothetical protein [Gaiellaceae bacterium]